MLPEYMHVLGVGCVNWRFSCGVANMSPNFEEKVIGL